MSRNSYDFLTESPLWSESADELDDATLHRELTMYREHVLAADVPPSSGLGVAFSARQAGEPFVRDTKRAALYFDEVLLPDPVFELTEWTRDVPRMPATSDEAPRDELIEAVREMKALTPLVRLGRVRFVPTTHLLESPIDIRIVDSEDGFESVVPEELRAWFRDRASVKKVVIDEHRRRLVLGAPPDDDTKSIQIEFGQLGRVATYDYMHMVDRDDDNRIVFSAHAPPGDREMLHAWLEQSVNRAAGGYLQDVVTDLSVARSLRCSYGTSCPTTADLVELLATPVHRRKQSATFALDLPIVDEASPEQLAALIEHESAAFEALRAELRSASEKLAGIEDAEARRAEAERLAREIAASQVDEVDRKVRAARRALKWSIPIGLATLVGGALGFYVAGDTSLLAKGAAILIGGAQAAGQVQKLQEPRALPGYFLWRLKSTS